jgi:KDEL-tailed cysteine endopeptidase
MVAVGYTWTGDRKTSYWIVKNSWGPWWGRKGYVYIAMDGTTDGVCGINRWNFAPNMQFDNIFDKV